MKTQLLSMSMPVALLSAFSLPIAALPALAELVPTAQPQLLAAKPETAAPEPTVPQSSGLATAVAGYRAHPDAASWQLVWKELRDLLASPACIHASATAILHANPALTDLGVKPVDAGLGSRVWSFPKVADAPGVIVQYQCPVGPAIRKVIGKGRHSKVVIEPAPVVTRFQAVVVPSTVAFKDAQVLRSTQKQVKSDLRDLVLIGNERAGGIIWIATYKMTESGLFEDTTALSSVPPFLVQNIAGNPSFSGNDLVLGLGGGGGPQSSGYKIVLKFIDGKFAMEGQAGDQGPSMVVLQFLQALQQNRLDVARAWLTDPKLISVPKYAGFMNRPSDRPFKIIAMSAPFLVGARFRIMTFDKTDLIIDVAKVKQQWAIKALYMAPPDPVAQKLVGWQAQPAAPVESASAKAVGVK